jgi:hypothetical protein
MSQKSNLLSGNSRYPMSEARQREWEHYEAMPLKALCAFCDWSFEGPTAKSREEALKHRTKKHPETLNYRRSRKQQRKLSSFRYVSLDQQDIKEVEEERKRRAFLNGIDLAQ